MIKKLLQYYHSRQQSQWSYYIHTIFFFIHKNTTMTQKTAHLTDLYFEQKVWVNELIFFKEEIKLFESRLEEVARKNTDKEMFRHLEHFQNQFIRQKEVIDELKHDIKAHENELEAFAKSHDEIAFEHTRFADQSALREEVAIFKKLYGELKHDFMRFLVRWM